jgi:DNA excision repair protein ERCC-5
VDLDISTESQHLPSVNQSTVSEESERERLQGLLSFENLEAELRREVIALEGAARTEQHHAVTLTSEAVDEAKELLKLFGIPYVQSPSEADAQCAVLQTLGLVDGIVSDDSDILVFGGDTVFRYAFSSQHELELYNMEDIQTELGLDHDSLIFLAFLLGGDYADGISKVGPRAGLDIVNAFPGPDGMLKFKAWLEAFQAGNEDYGMVLEPPSAEFIKRHGKLAMGMKLPPSFPNASVMDAYTNPKVDSSSEPFSWGWPDLSGLRQFATDKFGWTMDRIDSNLLPIIQKYTAALSDKQPKIETFFTHASIHGRKLPAKSPKKKAMETREASTGSLSGDGDAESEGQPTSLPHRGSPSLLSASVETPARRVSSRATQAKNSKKRKRAAGTSPLKPVLEAEREAASDDEYLEPAPQTKRGKRK